VHLVEAYDEGLVTHVVNNVDLVEFRRGYPLASVKASYGSVADVVPELPEG
jgi:hypothetical protein